MEIHGHGPNQLNGPDAKRRQAAARAETGGKGAGEGERLSLSLDEAEVGRYLQVLKESDPVDLHRVEDLRNRIADGSYTADASELADRIIESLTGDDGVA